MRLQHGMWLQYFRHLLTENLRPCNAFHGQHFAAAC
jgi:hypothetical protein